MRVLSKQILLLVCSWMLALAVYGQPPVTTLGPDAQMSVLTCAPGSELYSVFGHSALRVKDPTSGLDWVYNYGVFEFDTPNFVLKFARGKLRYYVLSYNYKAFYREYSRDQRAVQEQVLNLDAEQKRSMFDALLTNELPENKFYQYDFFFDNCSTRERDLLEKALGANLRYHPQELDLYGSYRDLIDPYLRNDVWTDFGIDLLLGMPTDAEAHQRGAMFLPDELFKALSNAEIQRNGSWQPLVLQTNTLLDLPRPKATAFQYGPHILGWGIFLVAILLSFFGFKKQRLFKSFDVLVFGLFGLLGIFMLLFWLGTDHQATYRNLNLLWALPTHLLFAILLLKKGIGKMARAYLKLAFPISVLVLATHWLLPQSFHPAVLPIMMALCLRLAFLYRSLRA